jgi:hypothetical protein
LVMGLLGFWIGRCARKLPFIDNNLPWTLSRNQIPTVDGNTPKLRSVHLDGHSELS